MRAEYDFSHADRGKFYRENAVLRLPVYLDRESMEFVLSVARRRKKDVSAVVNELIHQDMQRGRAAK